MSVPMQDENLVLHCASTDLEAACDSWFPLGIYCHDLACQVVPECGAYLSWKIESEYCDCRTILSIDVIKDSVGPVLSTSWRELTFNVLISGWPSC